MTFDGEAGIMRRILVATLFLIYFMGANGSTHEVESKSQSSKNYDDANEEERCLRILSGNRPALNIYEALPGQGWDNLQNKLVGNVVKFRYSKCKTTDDGRYLIPDSVYAIPKKSSNLDIFAEMFDHWSNFTSTTSSSINVKAGLHFGDFGIDGTFSHESEEIRNHQVEDKSKTVRVQARYVRYTAKLQPDSPLDDVFKRRLKKIAMNLQVNKTAMAQYESQLLVRDFGTHVISSVDGGAAIAKIDHIDSSYVESIGVHKKSILVAARASYALFNSIKTSYKYSSSDQDIQGYLDSQTHSTVKTYGGPVYKPSNFTLDQWASGIDADLVPIDRTGEPIYYLITPQSLPGVPTSIMYSLIKNVKVAVEQYYKFNIYRGCTKVDSPEFSYMANVDDGTCRGSETNFKFGGVYQLCKQTGELSENLCFGLEQENPLTGDFSCNSDNYYPVMLHQGTRSNSESRQSCRKCGFLHLRHCCTNYNVYGSATFSAYWCVARGSVPQQSGFLFGGIYTSTIPNPLTHTQSCPHQFHALTLGSSISICVSDEFELGFEYAIPFAGFFSCKVGNPLAIEAKNQNYSFKGSVDSSSMITYLKKADPRFWPKRCPAGYSMHLAAVEDDCEIHYCVKTASIPSPRPPPLRMPPFTKLPTDAYVSDTESKEFVLNVEEQEWISMDDASTVAPTTGRIMDINITDAETTTTNYSAIVKTHYSAWVKTQPETTLPSSQQELSKGVVAGIAVVSTLAGVLLVILVVRSVQRQCRNNKYDKIQDGVSDLLRNAHSQTMYGYDGNSRSEIPQ